MYSNNIVEILKAMPNVKKAYFLPFHIDHTKKFEGIINYETKTISLADRIGYLDLLLLHLLIMCLLLCLGALYCGMALVKRGLYSQRKLDDIQ